MGDLATVSPHSFSREQTPHPRCHQVYQGADVQSMERMAGVAWGREAVSAANASCKHGVWEAAGGEGVAYPYSSIFSNTYLSSVATI